MRRNSFAFSRVTETEEHYTLEQLWNVVGQELLNSAYYNMEAHCLVGTWSQANIAVKS